MLAKYKLIDYGAGLTTPTFIENGGQFYDSVTETIIGKVVEGVSIVLPAIEITKQEVIERQLAQHLLTPFGELFRGKFVAFTNEQVIEDVNTWFNLVNE